MVGRRLLGIPPSQGGSSPLYLYMTAVSVAGLVVLIYAVVRAVPATHHASAAFWLLAVAP
jgi:hypothetical protein